MIVTPSEQEKQDGFNPYEYEARSDTGRHGSDQLYRDQSTRSNETRPLTYFDEDFNYHSNKNPTILKPQVDLESPLVRNASDIGRSKDYQNLEYTDPFYQNDANPSRFEEQNSKEPLSRWKTSPFGKLSGSGIGKYPLDQRIEDKKRGIGRQKYPFLTWTLTATMIAIFIYELVLNARAQGTPISLKPVVNPMLGPSSAALINAGARFPPCMKLVTNVPPGTQFGCLNNTANPPDRLCSLESVCGFGGFHDGTPNQWFRFITPIFLHAGFVHILLNMLAQCTLSAQIEREMGSGGFLITYFAAGIFGNILGGNFSLVGVPSVGASGAIFGTLAVTWVDLFSHWKYHYRPVRKLLYMTIELIFGVAIGYIPYIDNFAHLGGFLMGLLVGTTFYPVISETKRHKSIMWAFRLVAIPLAIVLYIVLVHNFYTSDPYADTKLVQGVGTFRVSQQLPTIIVKGLTTFTTNST